MYFLRFVRSLRRAKWGRALSVTLIFCYVPGFIPIGWFVLMTTGSVLATLMTMPVVGVVCFIGLLIYFPSEKPDPAT